MTNTTKPEILRCPTCGGMNNEQWQPIETAPKNGSSVLLWGVSAGEISGISKAPPDFLGSGSYGGRTDYKGFDWPLDGGDAYMEWGNPTHWMPLPTPPKDGGK